MEGPVDFGEAALVEMEVIDDLGGLGSRSSFAGQGLVESEGRGQLGLAARLLACLDLMDN
jgi:hypothetical protein